ncbi:MAG TPA: DUF5985 family protein [Thermomicrobiales bacterium]|jgi:uncharacterized membrane protein|nr:DUF5985 family protein [Thermomicrobiales bacterium]
MAGALQPAIYLLCFATSTVCAFLLVRSYRTSRVRLLLWVAICFVLLAVNNLFVVFDVLFLPAIDLVPFRQMASFSAVAVLLFGFVWDAD